MAGDTYVPRRPPELPRSSGRTAPQRPARKPRKPQWVYTARRAGALLILALLLFAIVRACGGPADPEPQPQAETQAQTTAAVETTTAAATTTQAPPAHIESSRPQEMVVPAIGMNAKFEDGDCRVVKGNVDPGGLGKACAYTAPDKPYQLPGTDAGDIVVIAGHAAAGVPAVFDKLYNPAENAHTLKMGDTMYLRTANSGEWWLKYEVTDLHDPMKDALANAPEIWGNDPTPGRLVTISCVQPTNPFEDSVRNAVIGWRFAGVSAEPRD